jgi:hypothetical protein
MTPEARKLFLDHCEFALTELLDAYFAARDKGNERSLFKENTCCLLNDEVSYATLGSFRLLETPITGALWNAMHLIGEDLYAEGGSRLLRDMFNRLEAKQGAGAVFGILILDKIWDGIGNWRA